MKTIKTLNGVSLSIDESGQGTPVVLVHGLSSSKEVMFPIRDMLQDSFQCICYDTRGHGESEKLSHYTLTDHANDLVAVIREYGAGKPVDVIGFSMGSYIATAAAAQVPELVNHLILIGTKGDGKTSSVERIFREKGKDPNEASEIAKLLTLMGATFAPKTHFWTKLKMAKLQSPVKLTKEDKVAETEALHDFNNFPLMPKITAKTLVVVGQFDGINPPELGKAVASAIPNAEYKEVPDTAHMLFIEKPEIVAPILRDWLNK